MHEADAQLLPFSFALPIYAAGTKRSRLAKVTGPVGPAVAGKSTKVV